MRMCVFHYHFYFWSFCRFYRLIIRTRLYNLLANDDILHTAMYSSNYCQIYVHLCTCIRTGGCLCLQCCVVRMFQLLWVQRETDAVRASFCNRAIKWMMKLFAMDVRQLVSQKRFSVYCREISVSSCFLMPSHAIKWTMKLSRPKSDDLSPQKRHAI